MFVALMLVFLHVRIPDMLRVMNEVYTVSMHGRGTVTLPAEVRRELGLDRPGVHLAVEVVDGAIVMRPSVSVPADQAWFWSERWQRLEREADADIAAGRVARFDSAAALLDDLDGASAVL